MSQAIFNGPVTGHNLNHFAVQNGSVTVNNNGGNTVTARRYIYYPRNEDIVPRPDLQAQLDSLLPATNESQTAALCGLGGSGKTQLALDYAYRRCAEARCNIFWVHAENEATFSHDYKNIGNMLGLKTESLPENDLLHKVCLEIQKLSLWILVIDNADNLALFGTRNATGSKSLREYIPSGPGGTILWTTRDQAILGQLVAPRRGVTVSQMSETESVQLLAATRGNGEVDGGEKQASEALVKELGCLPLAISQAGAFMRECQMSSLDYLSLIQGGQKRWELLNKTKVDRFRREGVTNSILATWHISIQRIKRESKLAYDVLHTVVFLDNQNIQREVLEEAVVAVMETREADGTKRIREKRRGLQGLRRLIAAKLPFNQSRVKTSQRDRSPESMSQARAGEDRKTDIGRAVKRLRDFSLITARAADGSYEMHKLVQEGIRYQLHEAGNGEENYYARCALEVVDALFPEYEVDEIDKWSQCEKYLAHCVQVVEFGGLGGATAQAGRVLFRVTLYAFDRGMYTQAESLMRAGLGLLEKELGPNHEQVLLTGCTFAGVLLIQGRIDEAEQRCTDILQVCERVLGRTNDTTLHSMLVLSEIHKKFYRYEEAEQLLNHVQEIYQRQLGENHLRTLRCTANLAELYSLQGRYAEAEELQVRRLQQSRQVLGEMHPQTLMRAADLAKVYYKQGRHAEAEEMYIRLLGQQNQILGETHPLTLSTVYNLSLTQAKHGRLSDAIRLMEECATHRRQTLGPDHPHTKNSERELARLKRYFEESEIQSSST